MKDEMISAGLRVAASQATKLVKLGLSKLGITRIAKSRTATGAVTTAIGYVMPFVTDSPVAETVASELRVAGMTEAGNDLANKILHTEEKQP